MSELVTSSVFTIVRSHGQDYYGVMLYGATLEEFEKEPGFSFSPGAAYLRSLID